MCGRVAFALLILLSACAANRSLPDWTQSEPNDPQYYSTVVQVSRADADYRERAFDTALRNISLQISVQVEASLSLSETESYGVPGSEFSSWVQASSRTQLKDVQFVISHETKKDFWAWYRLSKEQYRTQRIHQRDVAIAAALDLMRKYDSSLPDYGTGIPFLLEALDHLADYLDMDLAAGYMGKDVNVYVELLSRLRALPQAISIAVEPATLDTVARRVSDIPLTISITGAGKPLKRFPFSCAIPQGSIELSAPQATNDSGLAEVRVKRVVDFAPQQSISIGVDKDHFLQTAGSVPSRKLFSALAFSPATLRLNVAKPSISVSTVFNSAPGSQYNKLLEDKLRLLNLEVKDPLGKADYALELNIQSQSGSMIPALRVYSAMADAQLIIRDNRSGAVISSESAMNIKATGRTLPLAEANTEPEAIKLFCNEYLFRIVNSTILRGD